MTPNKTTISILICSILLGILSCDKQDEPCSCEQEFCNAILHQNFEYTGGIIDQYLFTNHTDNSEKYLENLVEESYDVKFSGKNEEINKEQTDILKSKSKIQGYPRYMIIRNGRIINANADRPSSGEKILTELIKINALKHVIWQVAVCGLGPYLPLRTLMRATASNIRLPRHLLYSQTFHAKTTFGATI